MKVALCFWGLTRSLNHTLASIETCIFQPLREAGIEYSIFLHTYTLYRPYTNVRAGEIGLQLKNTAWKNLQPTKSIVENQDIIDQSLQFELYRMHGDPWGNDEPSVFTKPYETLDNHIRALRSLQQVTGLWTGSPEQFDAVMYLRPDVLYRRRFNIQWLQNLQEKTVLMSNFHLIDGCNDRFAIGKPSVMRVYGNRFTGALEYSRRAPLHSETYIRNVLDKNNINIQYIEFPFRRVRADGKVHQGDQSL